MTKLQVFCLIAVTICIVINNIKCAAQNECRNYICTTNYMLNDLNDNQKEQLVNQLIQRYTDENLQKLIFPPATTSMAPQGRVKVFDTIITREKTILEALSAIIIQEPTIDLSNRIDYDKAVKSRHVVLHTIFNYVLHHKMNHIQMCKNGEIAKCRLLGVATGALNPGRRYTQGCNDVLSCVIGLEAKGVKPVEKIEYVDLRLSSGLYETKFDII